MFLREHPLCVDCLAAVPLPGEALGRKLVTPATVVDHVIPHKGDQRLFWNRSNWAGRCAPHHNAKTATRDRGAWAPA